LVFEIILISPSPPLAFPFAHAQIEYKGKGYFSGKSYSFKATLKPPLPRSSRNRSLSTHHLRNIDESGILRRDVGEGGDYAACGGELEALGRGDSGERFRECKSGEDED